MDEDKIIVVGGHVGCGKTAWIHQQIALKEKAIPRNYRKILYLKAGTEELHIDQKIISIDFPTVKVFCDNQKADFIKELESTDMAYIELDNNLGLGYIDQLLNDLPYYPVAILSPGCKRCKWHSWAKEVLIGSGMKIAIQQMEILRIPTIGKVISGDDFNNFWNALINDTYGKVMRVKGIFHLEDGNIIYADFIYGVECIDFLDLNLSRYLHGEPKCFSAIEIVGCSLNKIALQQTIEKMYVDTYKLV
ncbi:MAG: GTP-binding protein [Cyanobacteria bacterium J06632_19]